jgi:transposase
VPAPAFQEVDREVFMAVMIGVDPHKGSHTAVVIGRDEAELARVTLRATRRQVDELLAWAARFEERTWAIESTGGLGYLLARQLVAAGEEVLDVPATLAARVRLLGSGRSNKNDPNDARSIAIAAMHAPRLARVGRDDHAGVLRLYAKRNHDLARARNRTACRLHALLAELVPGGMPKEINARNAQDSSNRSPCRHPSNEPVTPLWSNISRICVASTSSCARRSSGSSMPSTSRARRSPTSSGSGRTSLRS